MPAQNNEYPWLSYYGNYKFFEGRMQNHGKVSALKNTQTGLYDIQLTDGRVLKVFICECYSFGQAEYYETIEKLGPVDAIVINSNWCGYSMDVKMSCRQEEVGVFDISGFMAAINSRNYWEYMTEAEKDRLR